MINQYQIIKRLGAGGMAEVYLAEDTRLQRRVALKFLPSIGTQDEEHLRRFELEARAIAALSHPNVCTIHEVIETGEGRHCIVMEYVEGVTLRERMAGGEIETSEALEVAIQVASALALAHTAGIVHRDIKPENIMLRHDGYVKILDFGLAKLTERKSERADSEAKTQIIELKTTPGMVLGTVAYMSPEQARGLPVDSRTDVWSLGVVLYEMVTGQRPFAAPTPTDLIISIVGREPEPLQQLAPSAPAQLASIVSKALAKDREGRYHTADDLLVNLKDLRREVELETDASPYERPTANAETRPRVRRSGRVQAAVSDRAYFIPLPARPSGNSGNTRGGAHSGRIHFGSILSAAFDAGHSTEIKSLAVLPMVNLSGDPGEDYFADGMTDTLIAGLAKVGSLRVTSRTSVMQFKGSQKPLKEIARELNVDAIVEGSVQRFGDQVRINVQLIHAATDQHLLTQTTTASCATYSRFRTRSHRPLRRRFRSS
jgi:serine/threonine-protein kinase